MSVGSDLKRMGRFLEAVETTTGSIQTVKFVAPAAAGASPGVEIEVAVSLAKPDHQWTLLPTNARIDSSGRIQVELETDERLVPDIDGVTVTTTSISMQGSSTHSRQGHSDDDDYTPSECNRSTEASTRDHSQPMIAVGLRAEPVETNAHSSGDAVEASTQLPEMEGKSKVGDVRTATTDGGLATTTTDQFAGKDETEPNASDATDRSVPPFRDPDLLADVYERCDTFAEMSEAIDMDVTGETVRRYMIDYGIHEPNVYGSMTNTEDTTDTAEVADAEQTMDAAEAADAEQTMDAAEAADTEQTMDAAEGEKFVTETENSVQADDTDQPPILATDGFGIHEQITVDELAETIARSNTVYDVKRELGLGRAETRALLETLDLIDFVVGRLTTADQRNVDRDRILDRLRAAAESEPEPATPSVIH